MVGTPSPAKISRPSFSGVLPRHRLFRLLDHSRAHPVTWISGPPGSGKTTLAASYLDARRLPCLWYQVDEGDADVATFFYYLGMAARRAAPRLRKPLPLLTPEYLPGILTFSRRYFENLYSRLIPSAHRPPSAPSGRMDTRGRFKHKEDNGGFIIVFDNYQEVPEGSPFHEVLREGFLQIPEGLNIFIISRNDPSDVFVGLRANRLIETVGRDELKFTLDESKSMIRFLGHKGVPLRLVEQLHEMIHGWAAGIVLLLEGMKVRGFESVLPERHLSREIYRYFAREIFEKAESGIQDFLLKTSFFPQMSSGMAETLTVNPQAERILTDLTLRNYFTQKHESQTPFYQYHPLFREFLQALAGETFNPDDLHRIEKETAMILEANGRIENAIDLLIRLQDWADAVGLILKHASELASQGRGQTLDKWIKKLPESILEKEPWLLYWAGVCGLPFSPIQSHDLFEKAFNQFRTGRDRAGIFLSLSGLFDSTIFGLGSFKPFDQTIALLDEVLQEFPSFPSPEIEARLTAGMLPALAVRRPQHPDFERWTVRGLSLLQKTQDFNAKVQTIQTLIGHALYSGEFSKAEFLLGSLRGLAQSPDVTPLLLIVLKDLEVFYYWLTGAFEENQKAVTEGLELASKTGVHLWDFFLLGHGAAGALSFGDIETADALIKKMASYPDQTSPHGGSLYYFLSSWTSLIQGDLSKALSQSELALKFSVEAGALQIEAYHYAGYALVLHELGREQEALDHLAKSQNLARSAKVPMAEFMCLLAEAQFAFDKGDEQSGLVSLRRALCIGREKGYVNTYYWRPSVMAGLCAKALNAGIEPDYVENLIMKRHLFPEEPPVDIDLWPWPVRIYTLGGFQVLIDGKPLMPTRKVQKKPMLLLKALIAHGRKELAEDQLADMVWPEADGDAAHDSLKMTLSRLRHLVGNEKVIEVYEGKPMLNPHTCWVDAWAFERIFDKIEASWKGSRSGEETVAVGKLAEKAIGLYKGSFLPTDQGLVWSTSYRERLRNKYLRLCLRQGHGLEQTNEWKKAVEYYQKALEIDEFSEEFYQRLMVCCQRLGNHSEAVRAYQRCKRTLSENFGIDPSPQTQALYKNLLRKG